LPISFWLNDLLLNQVPFADMTVPERACQVEAGFPLGFAHRLRFAIVACFSVPNE
jgi:hypothetical protein